MGRTAAAVWTISDDLVRRLDERLGTPVDSYVNGSQTWLVDEADITFEFRLHPVASFRMPAGISVYELWEVVVSGLAGGEGSALHIGDEVRPLTSLWDGLECFAAYGDELEPAQLAAHATSLLGLPPDRCGLVDHDAIGDAWERSNGNVSVVALLLDQLGS